MNIDNTSVNCKAIFCGCKRKWGFSDEKFDEGCSNKYPQYVLEQKSESQVYLGIPPAGCGGWGWGAVGENFEFGLLYRLVLFFGFRISIYFGDLGKSGYFCVWLIAVFFFLFFLFFFCV